MFQRLPSQYSSFFCTLALLFSSYISQAQGVAIGSTQPEASAILDVSSTTKGFLPPRMTEAARNAINPASTAAGLLLFNLDSKHLNLWDGTRWVEVSSGYQSPTGFQQQESPLTRTYTINSLVFTYTVPANTKFIQVQATGASGTPSVGATNAGLGARLTAVLQVIPGEVLTVVVGKQGAVVSSQSNQIKGGGQATSLIRSTSQGSTGDVNTVRNALLVAGGGGGPGNYGNISTNGIGGNAGGTISGGQLGNNGNANGSGVSGDPNSTGGMGGTAGANGYGGGKGGAGQNNGTAIGGSGGGGGGIGSAGGSGTPIISNAGVYGGSGGEGYLSGGDGGSGTYSGSVSGAGGGGGGSSWVSQTALAPSSPTPVFGLAESYGDGMLIITPVQ